MTDKERAVVATGGAALLTGGLALVGYGIGETIELVLVVGSLIAAGGFVLLTGSLLPVLARALRREARRSDKTPANPQRQATELDASEARRSLPTDSTAPFGYVDNCVMRADAIVVRGWAIDPMDPPAKIRVTLDSEDVAIVEADRPRPDVQRQFPWADAPGFYVELQIDDVDPGTHVIVASAVDRDGRQVRLGDCMVDIA